MARIYPRLALLVLSVWLLAYLWPSKPSTRKTKTLTLTRAECVAAYPLIRTEVDISAKAAKDTGGVVLKRYERVIQGMVEGRIKDGRLFVIRAASDVSEQLFQHRLAVLSQIHRALVSAPEPIPDMVFKLTVDDEAKENTWSLSRCDDRSCQPGVWTMPHGSYWSWPTANIDTMDEVVERIETIEAKMPWDQKSNKAVWRGTPTFAPLYDRQLRGKLVAAAQGRDWADIQGLDGKANRLTIEQFCEYKYIIYAEGFTYSGRMPYHQACESVIITTPIVFKEHNTHLFRPLFSTSSWHQTERPVASAYSLPLLHKTWPLSYQASEANVIFVKPDWSDLDDVMRYLHAHPDIGRQIARNQRTSVREAGYLSMPAETCYWRELMHEWSKWYIANPEDAPTPEGGWRGMSRQLGWGELIDRNGEVNRTVLGERYETWMAGEVGRGWRR